MTFAVVVGVSLRSGYALPPRHPDDGIVTETGGGSTYRRRNAVQTNPATSILHLFRRAEAKLARRRDLNRLARARIAALACRAVLHLELPEAGESDLFALLRGLDDAGEHRVDGLPGRALLDARLARHVIDQVGYFHFGLLE